MAKKPKNWTVLRDVIEYAESLGSGYVVFKDQGSPCYGICTEAEMPTNEAPTNKVKYSATEVWDVDQKKREEIPGTRATVHGLFGKVSKRFAIYRTREKK